MSRDHAQWVLPVSLLAALLLGLVPLPEMLAPLRPYWLALAVGALLFNDTVVTSAVHWILGLPTPPALAWLAPVLGMLLWAPLFFLLDALRLRAWRRR